MIYGDIFRDIGTGGCLPSPLVKTEVISLGSYEIVVRLGRNDRFLGVEEIRVARDFLSLDQVLAHREFFDIEDLYED
jgi:hypothetical protein